MKKKIIIGNWKMNPTTFEEAKKLVSGLKKPASSMKRVETLLCPPALFFLPLVKFAEKSTLRFGFQDTFSVEDKGSYTGFISPLQAKNAGATTVILGHSERRTLGETDETLNKKVIAALGAGLRVVFCIGELERSHEGHYLDFIKRQIHAGLFGVEKKYLDRVMIAYEPVWVIGTKEAMTPHDIHGMKIYIRKVLNDLFGSDFAGMVGILYGGSVNPENCEAILREGEVDGLLVGRDSLNVVNFAAILAVANRVK